MNEIESVIKNDLCIGCGTCTIGCSQKVMHMSESGIYKPKLEHIKDLESDVCPFTENVKKITSKSDSLKNHEYLGKYDKLGVGYSVNHRKTSSSGGIVTWILEQMLIENSIDGALCVNYDNNGQPAYQLIYSIDDLRGSSGTKYYPLTMEDALKEVRNRKGRFAVTGIPCFINSLRMLAAKDSEYQKSFKFYIGIFCGGLKTKGFTDYLAQKSGGEGYTHPKYREKLSNSESAIDYGFSITSSNGKPYSIKMKAVGDMWGTGLFKPKACDYCEDLCAENADISLGDAWIQPYIKNPDGHNIIISRSVKARDLLKKGIEENLVNYKEITESQVCQSQQGNINHRRIGLAYRILRNPLLAKHLKIKPEIPKNKYFCIIQEIRHIVRTKSNSIWYRYNDCFVFDKKMYKYKFVLNIATRINHKIRRKIKTNH